MFAPYEALKGKQPDVSKFKTWGCTAWHHLHDHERKNKVSPVAVPSIHLGFDPQRNGYIIFLPHQNKITSSYHLTFQESRFMKFKDNEIRDIPPDINPLDDITPLYREGKRKMVDEEDLSREIQQPQTQPQILSDEQSEEHGGEHDDALINKCYHPRCTRGKHAPDEPHSFEMDVDGRKRATRGTPNYVNRIILDDVTDQAMEISTDMELSDIKVPKSFEEADSSIHQKHWRESMVKEITDLLKHDTWKLVKRSVAQKSGRRINKSKWAYTVKTNREGAIERFKSRFCVCGYSQTQGVDYDQSFSATLRSTSLRALLGVASQERLSLEHFDVTSAFTQAEIDTILYVEPPKGFPNLQRDERACKIAYCCTGS